MGWAMAELSTGILSAHSISGYRYDLQDAWRIDESSAHSQRHIRPTLGTTKNQSAFGELRLSETAGSYAGPSTTLAVTLGIPGKLMKNVDPWPTMDSAQIFPPCASTTLLHTASPIPVPVTSFSCNRLNGTKIT